MNWPWSAQEIRRMSSQAAGSKPTSDGPRVLGSWLANDGRWYPPETHPDPSKRPGWWLANDGLWYPPEKDPEPSIGPGLWLANDGRWYPPETHPDRSKRPGWSFASDGKWYPLSPDGRWRWTGSRWALAPPPKPPVPRWVVLEGAVWSVFLILWVPMLLALPTSHEPSMFMWLAIRGLGAIAVVATLLFGARLGWRSRWREVRLAPFVGAGVMVGALLVAALAADPKDEGGEEFLLFLYGPAVGGVWAVLSVGAAAGRWLRRSRRGETHADPSKRPG